MELVLLVVGLLWFGSGYAGYKLIQLVTHPVADPPIPTARITNAGGAEYAYQTSADLAQRGTRKIGKSVGVTLGLFLMLWPILFVLWLLMV